MRVVLVSTYEMGRQPFGLASPAAWLRARGHHVDCCDLAVSRLETEAVSQAEFVGFYLPMHTATRLALPVISRVRSLNPVARLCAFGLYAPLNEELLRGAGVVSIIGGEFEAELCQAVETATDVTVTGLERLPFVVPDRSGLRAPSAYVKLRASGHQVMTGYTEASRGCKHLCRHCPVVPVYQGRFRVVPVDVVIADVRQQVAAGARHITFGDPDFLNGPGHARAVVEVFAREFPGVTYDVTIKVEHLLRHRELLSVLRSTGCLFVTSAVESIQDEVLAKLEKGHTRADFIEVVQLCRAQGLTFAPTFIAFTPWTTRDSYRDLLRCIAEMDLVEHVAPVQLALRLLIPSGSRLLELDEIRAVVSGFDHAALVHRWRHPDPTMDELAHRALLAVAAGQKRGSSRTKIFSDLCGMAETGELSIPVRATIPYLDEPWYC